MVTNPQGFTAVPVRRVRKKWAMCEQRDSESFGVIDLQSEAVLSVHLSVTEAMEALAVRNGLTVKQGN